MRQTGWCDNGSGDALQRGASRVAPPLGMPGHFPQMAIRILKVACVPAPKRLLGWLNDDGASVSRLMHDCIDFSLGRHVVPERELRWTGRTQRKPRVVGDAAARPERKP